MIIMEGNLLHTPIQIIAHQVNSIVVMNAGVARQIKDLYPEVYYAYANYVKDFTELNDMSPLGECFVQETDDERHIILNVFGQESYGRDKRYTDYGALKKGFVNGIRWVRDEYQNGEYYGILQLTIAIPYKIGCGLAGGDWEVVKKILEEIEQEENVLFVAYEL